MANGEQVVGALRGSYDGRSVNVSRLVRHFAHRRGGVATAVVARFTTPLNDRGAGGASVFVLDRTPDADRWWAALEFDDNGNVPICRRSAPTSDTNQWGSA